MTAIVTLVLLAASAPTFEAAFRAGLAALDKNDPAEAQAQFEAAAKLQPTNPQIWLALAQAYSKQNKTEQADRAAGNAESFGSNQPLVLHALTFYYAESRRPALAASFEARYAESQPLDTEAFPRAVELYLRAGEPKAAISAVKKALVRAPADGMLHKLLAMSYEADKDFAKAAPEYERAVQLRPFDEASYLDASAAYVRQRRYAEALRALDPAAARFDKSARLQVARADALQGLQRGPEAVDALLRAVQLEPGLEETYVKLGASLDAAGAKMPDVAGALASYASSKPADAMSNLLYAKALAAQQADPSQYEPLLRRSIQANAALWEAHFLLGGALEKGGDWAGAAAEYKTSIELNPKVAGGYARLAGVYDRLGKRDEAKAARAQALKYQR